MVFMKATIEMYNPRYPKTLILEYGIDRPGEMDFMCDIVEPDIAVFTRLSANHISQFGDADSYYQEKKQLIRQSKKKASMIVANADDKNQSSIRFSHSF